MNKTVSIAQSTFTGGEWSPSAYERSDLQGKYNTALRTLINFIIHPHGPVSNRPGTYYVGEPDSKVRLIPFQFSVVQGYILEFGDEYMRVIKDGGYVMDGDVPYEIVTPYGEDDLDNIKYEQSADIMWLWDNGNSAEYQLTRTDHDAWTLTATTYGSGTTAPTNFARSAGSGSGHSYVVTAVVDGVESVASSAVSGGAGDTFTWTAVSGADEYNVYDDANASGVYYWLCKATTATVKVPDAEADETKTPPVSKNPFSGAGNYPGVGAFHKQRLWRARTDNKPDTVFGSVIGDFDNMNVSSPLRADDAVTKPLASRQVNEITWLVSFEDLIVGTVGAEWLIKQDDNGSFLSGKISKQSEYGSAHILPLVVGETILFVENSGKKIRDLIYSLEKDGYTGDDLSILADHLFEDSSIVDWTYQRYPDSVIWIVLADGSLIGLTYYREHEVWGWHRHETYNGDVESVATLRNSDGSYTLYLAVNRLINGSYVRSIEYMAPRYSKDIKDAYFVDCGLSYDVPVTITGATNADPCVITAASHGFIDGDYVDIVDVEGMTDINNKRFKVANASTHTFSLQTVEGEDVDSSDYGVYIAGGEARKAVNSVSGLDHLEGETVVALADGNVVTDLTVSSGEVSFSGYYSRIHVGLPYTSDLETLDVEFQLQSGTIKDKRKTVKSAAISLRNTRALQVGPSSDRLKDVWFRTDENYDDPTRLFTGIKDVNIINAEDTRAARIFIRNTDPVPVTVTGITLRVDVGE